MNRYLVVAESKELELPLARIAVESGRTPIVTGVGGTNVIKALRDIPRDSDILNVGYCGSDRFPIGAVLWIGETRLWHPNVEYDEETFRIGTENTICLTAGDFVTEGDSLPACSCVDMELAYIASFGFETLRAVKYVSDNLDIKRYRLTAQGIYDPRDL